MMGHTVLPPSTAEATGQLLEVMQQLLTEQQETNRLLRNEKKMWLTAEEAAEKLGKPITKSGSYKTVLAYARKHGQPRFLRTFGSERPYTYLRTEVEALARAVATGQTVLP
ncbi:MAG: hypothetical protein AAGA31_08610 [Bacteroidota bacterium]